MRAPHLVPDGAHPATGTLGLAVSDSTYLKNMTTNPGILPLELGPAKLQRTKHTLIHYYYTETLSSEFTVLKPQYHSLLSNVSDETTRSIISPQLKNINVTLFRTHGKLSFLRPSSAAIHTHKNRDKLIRNKRGLVNALGSGVKLVTGNVGSSDGERYEKLLDQLKNGETILENQMKQEYSLSSKINRLI